jgi:hypothetical protein
MFEGMMDSCEASVELAQLLDQSGKLVGGVCIGMHTTCADMSYPQKDMHAAWYSHHNL